ncbi:toxin-antitoxin system YwqK family antitoxin [Desulfovibrio litoralis]|uniref:MORN repeat variant n=1 Tax=Desulfovibrio litoralis DSM 11393 TaxID=1121455 RepID=A0A1M7SFM4_9BACT|nr:toxin-antitoxin system YwqK family antitoxin [Desulfovibrio litoralis]SHN57269.1 MORN repeat variant [Desulfovibrio litoralis DSM 11393]
MKNFIVIVTLCLFCLLSIHTPNAFSQESCPKTIEEVQKNKRYELVKENLYEFKQAESSLRCAYRTNGTLRYEIPYKNGKVEGTGKEYYENGTLKSEYPYVAGKKEGMFKSYSASGKILLKTPYVAGKVEGMGKSYYESGKLKAEIPFVADKIEGIFKHYNESGKLEFEISYENNLAVSGICYKKNGETRSLTDQELGDFMRGEMPKCD